MNWIWALFKLRVDAAITNRIVTFHQAMLKRGQIRPINHGPVAED